MEKVLQHYDKERMRMAMLKHEETFRQQVYELHRLYKIQKMLMDEQQQRSGKQTQTNIVECNNNSMVMEDDHESELELTLSLGPLRRGKTDKSESGQSTVSSSSTGSTQTRKTSPKDVNSSGLTRSEDNMNQFVAWGSGAGKFPQGSGSGSGSGFEPGFSNGQQNNSHPAWLFQALSLKLT